MDEVQRVIEQLRGMVGPNRGDQSALARKIGVTRHRLNEWLNGKRLPDRDSWIKIQAFFRRTPAKTGVNEESPS